MERRKFLASSAGLLTALAGCTGTEATGEEPTQGTTESTTTTIETTEPPQTTTTQTETPTTQSPTETTTTKEVAYTVYIEFEGEWQGSITAGGSSRSIQGTGSKKFEITGDAYMVAANAQKETDGDRKLTVQIVSNNKILGEASTTASYGVAQATSQGGSSISGDSNSGGSSNTTTATENTFAFKVNYEGEWQGSLNAGGSARSIDGTGSKKVELEGSPSIIAGNAQKKDDSSQKLTVQILKNGEVVKEASTTAEYGMAQVSYSSF